MIVCPQCGSANEDDEQFCGSCGTYLEWDAGQRGPAREPAREPQAPPAPEGPADPPVPGRVPDPEAVDAPEARPGRHRVTGGSPAPADPGAESSAPSAPDPVPAPTAASTPVEAAASALVATPPAPRETPAAQQPAAVRPGVPAPPRPARAPRAAEPPPSPGDLVCGTCGAGNADTRKFCRRCGATLADAKVQPRRSWWSRLWRPEPKPGPAAGYRPPTRRRRFPTRPVVAIAIIGAVVAVGLTMRPEIERARISVIDRVQGNAEVNPSSVTASSALPERPAEQARDGATNLAWSPAEPGDGVGQYLDLAFAQPFRLTRVLVYSGASDVETDYLAGSSPQELILTATTAAGTQEVRTIPLADRVGLQNVQVAIDDVVGVRLLIGSTYRATPETYVAIAEVEFRGRR